MLRKYFLEPSEIPNDLQTIHWYSFNTHKPFEKNNTHRNHFIRAQIFNFFKKNDFFDQKVQNLPTKRFSPEIHKIQKKCKKKVFRVLSDI